MSAMAELQEFQYEGYLMGSDFSVSIIDLEESRAHAAFHHVLSMGHKYENTFSRFIPDSELSQLNEHKSLSVSPMFMEVMLVAHDLVEKTNSLFNPLVQIERFGYTKNFAALTESTITLDNDYALYNTTFSDISINKYDLSITLHKNQKLDFGGFLKGYVAQKMIQSLKDFHGAIVNIGGDIYTHGYAHDNTPFEFCIHNPVTDDAIPITAHNSGIATSGIYKRKWSTETKEFFHILNTDGTANPDTDLISATVLSGDGAEADAFATVAICLGSQKAYTFLADRGNPCVLITQTGEIINTIAQP